MALAPMIVAGMLITLFSFILHTVGFSTPYWNKDGSSHSGIWEVCNPTGCSEIDTTGPNGDTMKKVQAIELTANVAYLLGCFWLSLKLNVLKQYKVLYLLIGIGNILGAVLGITGVIVYATRDKFQLSNINFSFVFINIAAIADVISSVLFFLGYRWVEQ